MTLQMKIMAAVAAVATTSAVVAPCQPAAPTPSSCERIVELGVDMVALFDAADYHGVGDDQAQWSQMARDVVAAAIMACEEVNSTSTTTSTTEAPTSTTEAPTSTSTTVETTTTTAPPTAPPGLPVDEAAIPSPNPNASDQLLVTASSPDPLATDGVASVRLECAAARWNFDDRLLAPGAPRATHLHVYFGNISTDANSDGGLGSTCSGGRANHSSYWEPALIDRSTNAPVQQFHSIGQHTGWAHRGDVRGNKATDIYYKSGYRGVTPDMIQQWMPFGLRVIAGDPRASSPQPAAGPFQPSPVGFGCVPISFTGPPPMYPTINEAAQAAGAPSCAPGNVLTVSIEFPQCWDGRNLDSADHRSHMSYPLGWPDRGCPSSHPVALPLMSMHTRYVIAPGQDTRNFALSSDTYTQANPSAPAGYSLHADVIFQWEPDVAQAALDGCYHPARDCGMNDVGALHLTELAPS